jgi:hypothetical protein
MLVNKSKLRDKLVGADCYESMEGGTAINSSEADIDPVPTGSSM